MNAGIIILVVAVIAAFGFILGRRRALSLAATSGKKLHSLPGYYGHTVALFAAVPSLFVLIVWLLGPPLLIASRFSGIFPYSALPDV